MDTQGHHDAPELVQSTYPEAVPPTQQYQYGQYQQYPPQNGAMKPEDGHMNGGAPYSAYSGSQFDGGSPHQYQMAPVAGGAAGPGAGRKKGTVCGLSALVFALCAVIAVLSAAVIGLAAGTGVEASRANTAEIRAAQLSTSLASAAATPAGTGAGTGTSTPTSASPTATSTPFAVLDRNCSLDAAGVTGTTYDAFSIFGQHTFTVHCNKDAGGGPLLSLFTSDFDTCMDACASYDTHATDANNTCGSVSFIPLWTSKASAQKGKAPGNCYLKPPQTGNLNTPNIGTECHAAVLNSD